MSQILYESSKVSISLSTPGDIDKLKTVLDKSGDIDKGLVDSITLNDNSDTLDIVLTHRAIKRQAKNEIKKKFIVGHTYKLAYRKQTKYYKQKQYILVKYIYAIKDVPVNILIMKEKYPSHDTYTSKFSLNYAECLSFHIKYEPGLEVFSMNLNWIDVTKDDKDSKLIYKTIQ